jgi:glycosyltransferase involved in cell wall biosynthesis
MKILWLSHLVPYPPKAGVLLRAHHLVNELSKHHEVHLIAFNQKTLIEPYFESYEKGTQVAYDKMRENCKRVHFIDCPMDKFAHSKLLCALKSLVSKYPYNINWLKDDTYGALVKRWHQEESYDLIHCDTISLTPYVEGINDCLLSLDHHNVESHMLIRRSELDKNLLKKLYFWQEGKRVESYEKKVCPQFTTNLTCSELDSIRFEAFCPNASFTEISNGVDINAFTPAEAEPKKASLIFIGTLDWYPNTRAIRYIANEIWPKIKNEVPDIEINIIGAGAPSDLIKLSEIEKNFNVLGFVDDLKPYLDNATAYICPIDDGGGTKLKLLDAFASGKAVIAHKVACEGLKVEDGKQALIANDPDTYVKQIKNVIADKALRQQLEKNARTHAEKHFSFSSIGKQLADHFSTLRNIS